MRNFLSHLTHKHPVEPKPPGHRRMKFAVATLSVALIAGLAYFARNRPQAKALSTVESFNSLHQAYEMGGIEFFNKQKDELRALVARQLKDFDRAPASAVNIATYLFPDLLPEENFEKAAARELWVPLEKSIEGAPHSPESRQKFEQLRATLWNYENPDRTSPELSSTARQVIRIYDVLSGP